MDLAECCVAEKWDRRSLHHFANSFQIPPDKTANVPNECFLLTCHFRLIGNVMNKYDSVHVSHPEYFLYLYEYLVNFGWLIRRTTDIDTC